MRLMAADGPMPPDLALRPMREDEYAGWLERAKAGYAEDIEVNGDTPHDAAVEKSDRDFARILPDGLSTPGHAISVVADGDRDVGILWVAERETDGRRILFVYDLEVDQAQRGKGYGRGAMLLAEQEARRRGIERIELNVFGGNQVARRLYRSLGYLERAILMGKDLGDAQPSR
jgi:ribosomal protein S18 acetylase RimI-like enzyme